MFENISGISVYYESVGNGIPLVCIHGYGVDHRAIKSGLEPVCRDTDGFRRIYFDLPGMGRSASNDQILSSDDMLEIVLQFIDAQVGPDQPFALAGYSYGGYLARGVLAQMASRVRGMLLICPVIRFRRRNRRIPEFRCCEQDREFVAGLSPANYQAIDGFVTIQTRAVWERYHAHIHPALGLADTALMARIRDTELSVDPDHPGLPVFEGPASILLGRYDVSVGYKDAWQLCHRFPDGDFVVLGRSGHLLHMEQPVLFHTHVRAWLDRILTGN